MTSLAFELTGRCNQRCTYCYNDFRDDGGAAIGELDGPRLLELADRMIDEAAPDHITLTGGEPFLRGDVIHELIDTVNARGLGVVIISNGGAITDQNIARLAAQNVHYVQLTLAGPDAETHDAVCGRRSFVRVVDTIARLQAAGVRVGGSYICTSHNYQRAAEVARWFTDHGILQMAFNRFNPSGYSTEAMHTLMPTRSQVRDALVAVNAHAAETPGMRVVNTMPIPPCVLDEADFPHIDFGHCSVGTEHEELAIGPDGSLRGCTLLGDSYGDLLRQPAAEVLANAAAHGARFRQKIPAFCHGCPHAEHCLGGCGAAARWAFGDAAQLDPFVAQHVMPDFKNHVPSRRRLPVLGATAPAEVSHVPAQ